MSRAPGSCWDSISSLPVLGVLSKDRTPPQRAAGFRRSAQLVTIGQALHKSDQPQVNANFPIVLCDHWPV